MWSWQHAFALFFASVHDLDKGKYILALNQIKNPCSIKRLPANNAVADIFFFGIKKKPWHTTRAFPRMVFAYNELENIIEHRKKWNRPSPPQSESLPSFCYPLFLLLRLGQIITTTTTTEMVILGHCSLTPLLVQVSTTALFGRLSMIQLMAECKLMFFIWFLFSLILPRVQKLCWPSDITGTESHFRLVWYVYTSCWS